jgi:hypothetical protein
VHHPEASHTPYKGVSLVTKNVGSADRIIRTIVAIALGVLILTGKVTGMLAIVLGVVGVVFLATSAVSVCPAYKLIKISTIGDTKKK